MLVGPSLALGGVAAFQAQDAAVQRDQVAVPAGRLASGVDRQCAGSGAVAAALSRAGLCPEASRVLPAPAVESMPPATTRQRTAPTTVTGLTETQLAALRAQIASDLDGRFPTVQRVARIVADQLAANPPKDGKDAPLTSGAQIAAVVAAYCAGDVCRGADGADAPPVTDEQVAAAVTQIMAADPERFRGEKGDKGDDAKACPDGYEFRPVVSVTADGGGYADAVQCVDPDSSYGPQPPPSAGPLLPPG